jgi:hypothetical protein
MGNPGPQPKSITAAPCGSVRAHSRTAFTPMPFERVCAQPRPAKNSAATLSYPLDRSVIEWSPLVLYGPRTAVERTLSIRCSMSPPTVSRHTTRSARARGCSPVPRSALLEGQIAAPHQCTFRLPESPVRAWPKDTVDPPRASSFVNRLWVALWLWTGGRRSTENP